MLVGRLKSDPSVRVVAHDKSSLAPEGKSIAFSLDADNGFQWIGYCDVSVDDVLSGTGSVQTKTALMEDELRRMLVNAVPAEEVFKRAAELGISERTVNIAKKNVGVDTEKVGNRWNWRLSDSRL